MKNIKNAVLVIGLVSMFSIPTVFAKDCGPSWCNSSGLNSVEKMICDDQVLKSADILMAHTYKELMKYKGKEGHEGMWPREVYSNQLDWVANRNQMSKQEDILKAYMSRTHSLNSMLQYRSSLN